MYKSNTHEEMFFHFHEPLYDHAAKVEKKFNGATVFLRCEMGVWKGAASLCSSNDPFSRKVGRQVARRRFFSTSKKLVEEGKFGDYFIYGTDRPTYDGVKEFLTRKFSVEFVNGVEE